MQCPTCQHLESKVVDSREARDSVRRRRECLGCGHRFTTFERIEFRLPVIVKKDGESCSHGPMVTATGSPWGMELKSYLFVDDLVDSGNTHQRVRDKLHGAKCVGALLYYDAMEWPADLIPKIPELRKIPHAFNENVYKYHVYTGF